MLRNIVGQDMMQLLGQLKTQFLAPFLWKFSYSLKKTIFKKWKKQKTTRYWPKKRLEVDQLLTPLIFFTYRWLVPSPRFQRNAVNSWYTFEVRSRSTWFLDNRNCFSGILWHVEKWYFHILSFFKAIKLGDLTEIPSPLSRDRCSNTAVALCFLWYRRLSLLHPHFFPYKCKNVLLKAKDRPNTGRVAEKLASEAYRTIRGVARNSIASRAFVGR